MKLAELGNVDLREIKQMRKGGFSPMEYIGLLSEMSTSQLVWLRRTVDRDAENAHERAFFCTAIGKFVDAGESEAARMDAATEFMAECAVMILQSSKKE